jgi:Flp pilus assembly protein TadB
MEWLFVASSGLLAAMLVLWYVPGSDRAVAQARPTKQKVPMHQAAGIRDVVDALAPTLQNGMPGIMATQDQRLLLAGRPMAGVRASQLLALFLIYPGLIALLFLLLMVVGRSSVGSALLIVSLSFAAAVGAWFIFVQGLFSRRKKRLDQQFPYFLDFVLMMKEAGETLAASLRLYVANNPGLELTDHMRRVVAGIETHKDGLPGSVMEFHEECASDLGKTTLLSILKAEEMGARSSAMLRDIASDMRLKRYEEAEKTAEALKSKSMFPAVLMFMGAFVMVLAGSLGQMFTGIRG